MEIESSYKQLYWGRRSFVKILSLVGYVMLFPVYACRNNLGSSVVNTRYHKISRADREVLLEVMNHLFPNDGNGPDAEMINAVYYYEFILNDKHLEPRNRKLLLSGLTWADETAKEMYNAFFKVLPHERKEKVLREIETHKNGRRWLSKVMNCIFEALLGSPAYYINANKSGWKWLNHRPGVPQARSNYKYGDYGYGL